MASKWKLIQTEKAYNLQKDNVYTLAYADKGFKTNKIELTKFVKSFGLNPLSVTSTKTYQKTKVRGKKRVDVKQYRPKKWYVKLKIGEVITEDTINEFNKVK